MKILIPLHNFITWNGGVDLIRLIVTALRSVADEQPLQLVFAMPEAWPGETREATQLRTMTHEFTQGWPVLDCGDDGRSISRLAVEVGATIVFPSMQPIRGSHVRKVGYIYDFQHRDLPGNFSAAERVQRDEQFAAIAANSDAIFTTSRFVAEAVQRHLGVSAQRVLTLPFTPYAQPSWFATASADAQARHATGERYVMICNHFWIHKDHATALRAFAQVAQRPEHSDLNLVMTGATSDFRDPAHFQGIVELIESLGIASRCRILGLIPKGDQIALLRAARVLIQPTRYEGGPGGGSSYEAIGLGLPAVLSDIPVNHEARADGVAYFRAGDVGDLTDTVLRVLALPRHEPAIDALLEQSQARLQHAGRSLLAGLRGLLLPRVA